jgi:hypothetical protein
MRYYVDLGKNYEQITNKAYPVPRYVTITGIIPMLVRNCALTIVEQSKNGEMQWIKGKNKPLLHPLTEKEKAKLLIGILQSVNWDEIQHIN